MSRPEALLSALFFIAIAGCDDALTEPLPPPGDEIPVVLAPLALQDALDRILPSLGTSSAAIAVGSALGHLLEQKSEASLLTVEAALQRVTAERPDVVMEADAIWLAATARP